MGESLDLVALAAEDVHAIPETVLLVRTEVLLEARARLDAEIARSLQALEVREVTTHECGRSTRGWLVEEQHLAPAEAGSRLWVARRLPQYPDVAAALAAGDINHEHARVILGCLLRLPGSWRDAAQDELLTFAREHDPFMLAALCREVRVRSGADEDAEAAAHRQYASRHLTLAATIDGMVSISGMLDPEAGATLHAALTPLTAKAGEIDDRTAPQRRADALTDLARIAMTTHTLPDHGGEPPQVAVTIPLAELQAGLTAHQISHATLGGSPISAQTARRLACDASIIPAVLGARSEVLDLGRSTPTWNRAQRRALRLQDQGCVFPKCQASLDRCQIHHDQYWSHHGPTNLTNGIHLCHYHHRLVHHENWTITRTPNGTIDAHRKTIRQHT